MLLMLKKLLPLIILLALVLLIWSSVKNIGGFFTKKEQVIINQTVVLQEIEALGKIELVKYHFKDVVEFEKNDYSWLPSSKVVLIAGGEAVGCIDLTKIKHSDLIISRDTATITLPLPELCYFKIDHEKSKVFSLEYTYFQDKNLIDQAYRAAEKQLKQSALDLKILEKTRENAEIILKPLLEKITGKKVLFIQNPLTSDVPLNKE